MNWSRAKTILIIFFLCTNVFLLSTLIISTGKTSVITDDIIDSTVSILENNRIYIDPELIPRKTRALPLTEAYNIISDYESFSKILAGEDAGMTGTDLYSGENGSISYRGDKFDFSAKEGLFSDETEKINSSNAQQIAQSIMKSYGFNDNNSAYQTFEKDGTYTVVITKEKDGLYYFNCKLSLVIQQSGLKKISGSWFYENNIKSEDIALKSVAGVLIDYISLSNRPSSKEKIVSLELGYSILEENVYHQNAMLSPCWKITLDGGSSYILNAAETGGEK